MKAFLSQIWNSAVMALWIGLLAWGAWWMASKGWHLMGRDWVFTGFAMIVVAGLLVLVSVRGSWLVMMLLAGRTTSRLARRDFRDSVADLLMVAKTGLWKE